MTNADGGEIVARGLFLLNQLFCGDSPDPPASLQEEIDEFVDALPDDASDRQVAEIRLERGQCAACHATFDPLAYSFEVFDFRGAPREVDEHGNVMSSDGWIPGNYTATGRDQSYESFESYMALLQENARVRECLVQRQIEYAVASRIGSGQALAIEQVSEAATDGNHRGLQRVFRLHADIYAMALRCDLVRFGNLMFESAGGHTNLRGTYSALGDSTDFPGTSQHDSYFHGNQPDRARLYQHFAMSNLAHFLSALDDTEFLEGNGQTVLENMTLVIGTEYGWNHSKSNVFHAVVGGRGRFATGNFTDRSINCIDLYNTIAAGHGIDANIGAATGVESEGDGSFVLA